MRWAQQGPFKALLMACEDGHLAAIMALANQIKYPIYNQQDEHLPGGVHSDQFADETQLGMNMGTHFMP